MEQITGTCPVPVQSKSEFDVGGVLVAEDEKIGADQFELVATYNLKTSERFSLGLIVETRVYSDTPAEFTGLALMGAGVTPAITLSDNVSLLGRIKFLTGKGKADLTVTGVDAGLGLRLNF